jgi:multiple sugar transport system permease protein
VTAIASRQARPARPRIPLGRWAGFTGMVLLTAFLLSPILLTFWRALTPGTGTILTALAQAFAFGPVLVWLANSTLVTVAAVVVTVVVAAPAGYVLSRARGRRVDLYALGIFAFQAVPIILFLVPLFVLFAQVGLDDNLAGLALVYIGMSVAVGVWMMSSAFEAIPMELEEAAWLDGCSVLTGFLRVVLPNALTGVLSTAVFTFLLAWNDYWIAVVLIMSNTNYTVGIGLAASYGSPVLSLIGLLPPLAVFVVLHRYFTFGGVTGSLAGT